MQEGLRSDIGRDFKFTPKPAEENNDEDVLTSAGNLSSENGSFSAGIDTSKEDAEYAKIHDQIQAEIANENAAFSGSVAPTEMTAEAFAAYQAQVTNDINRGTEGVVEKQTNAETRRTPPPIPENLPVEAAPDVYEELDDADILDDDDILDDEEPKLATESFAEHNAIAQEAAQPKRESTISSLADFTNALPSENQIPKTHSETTLPTFKQTTPEKNLHTVTLDNTGNIQFTGETGNAIQKNADAEKELLNRQYTPDQRGRDITDRNVPQEDKIIIDPEYQTEINQEETERKAFDANIDGQIEQALQEMHTRDTQTLAEKYQKEQREAWHKINQAKMQEKKNLENLRDLIASMPDDTPNTSWKEAQVTAEETRKLQELDLEHAIDRVESVKISSNERETERKNNERFNRVDTQLKERLQTFENQFGPLTQDQKSRLETIRKTLDEAKKEGNALKYENLSSRFEKTLEALSEEAFMEQGNNINTLATNEHQQRARDLKKSLTQTEIDRATKPKSILKTIGSYFGSLFRK